MNKKKYVHPQAEPYFKWVKHKTSKTERYDLYVNNEQTGRYYVTMSMEYPYETYLNLYSRGPGMKNRWVGERFKTEREARIWIRSSVTLRKYVIVKYEKELANAKR